MQRLRQIILVLLSIICLQVISEPSEISVATIFNSPPTTNISQPNDLDDPLQIAAKANRLDNDKLQVNSKKQKQLNDFIESRDGAMLVAPNGSTIFSKNSRKPLIPASTLKVFTALIAIHHLGESYRFSTDFYLDSQHNLKIKGYGDPLLISESLKEIARELVVKVDEIRDIIIDNSYFQIPLTIPGKNKSLEPYDAPNGALCVNFNTVSFKKVGNIYVSGEEQTPLLPFALAKVRSARLKKGRIMLTGGEYETLQYAGEMFRFFFNQAGINIKGTVRQGVVDKQSDKLILRYLSQFSLNEVISRLMKFSNNFIANQLFLASGATVFGPPATLAKAIQLSNKFAKKNIEINHFTIVEGSGLSRQNKISAASMIRLLNTFEPYYQLLRQGKKEYYKTGTLSDVKSRVGYLEDKRGRRYPFAVLINTPGKTTDRVMKLFRQIVNEN